MRMRLFAVLAATVFLAATLSAKDVISGTWMLNVAKSKYGSGAPPKSQITILEEREGGLHETVTRVNADGTTTKWDLFAKYDGKDVKVTGDPSRDAVALKKVDDHTVDVTNKKNNVVTTHMKIVVAPDGKTRTNTVTGTDASGKPFTSVMLFERK